MTLQEIAMFKTFTKNKGMDELFIGYYSTKRYAANPFFIEDYLKQVEAERVYLDAFAPLLNYRYGADHWNFMQERFNTYLKEKRGEYTDRDVKRMSGRSSVLRTNWDKKNFWKEENRIEAAKRLGINLSDEDVVEIINEHIRQGVATPSEMEMLSKIDDKADSGKSTEQHDMIQLAEDFDTGDDDDFLSSLESVHTKKKRNSGYKLGKDGVSVSYNGKHGYITFNKFITDDIKPFKYMSLKKNTSTGEVFLFFNNEQCDGNANVTGMTEKNGNANVTCKDMIGKLFALLNLPEGSAQCKIEVAARKPNYLAYKITKR